MNKELQICGFINECCDPRGIEQKTSLKKLMNEFHKHNDFAKTLIISIIIFKGKL